MEHVNKMALNTEPGSPASAVAALFFLCSPKQLARLISPLSPKDLIRLSSPDWTTRLTATHTHSQRKSCSVLFNKHGVSLY